MPKVRSVHEIRTTQDAIRWVRQFDGVEIVNGGRHVKIVNSKGVCPLPHEKELCAGTRHSIIKTLIAMGLTCLAIIAGLETMGVMIW